MSKIQKIPPRSLDHDRLDRPCEDLVTTLRTSFRLEIQLRDQAGDQDY